MTLSTWLSLYSDLFINRSDDYAMQLETGRYRRVGKSLEHKDLAAHLLGKRTYGSYLMDQQGRCRFAVLDDDTPRGLRRLYTIHKTLEHDGVVSYLERSRRGGHLWVFFSAPLSAALVRSWLLPYTYDDMEFYPKQDASKGYGSLIRLPLGIHRLTGKRYSFVGMENNGGEVAVSTLGEAFRWLGTIQRVQVPLSVIRRYGNAPGPDLCHTQADTGEPRTHTHQSFSTLPSRTTHTKAPSTIREWNATQDPLHVISRYITLDTNGIGRCPFGWHHKNGDQHSSFKVYRPGVPGGYCWYCYTWQRGGSLFDFLRYYHDLDARTLWHRLQEVSRKENAHE